MKCSLVTSLAYVPLLVFVVLPVICCFQFWTVGHGQIYFVLNCVMIVLFYLTWLIVIVLMVFVSALEPNDSGRYTKQMKSTTACWPIRVRLLNE